jgi:hypothetical protein
MMGTPNCTYTTVPVLETSSTFEMQFAREFKCTLGTAQVNIITVLRVNMLHCTFIKGKIIVIDNWKERGRMEGF